MNTHRSNSGTSSWATMSVLLVVLTLMASSPLSLEAQTQFTGGVPNGRFWVGASHVERVAWVSGFMSAETMLRAEIGYNYEQGKAYTCSCTAGEIAAGITRFYEEPAYRSVPVSFAFKMAVARVRGTSAADVDAMARKELWLFDLLSH